MYPEVERRRAFLHALHEHIEARDGHIVQRCVPSGVQVRPPCLGRRKSAHGCRLPMNPWCVFVADGEDASVQPQARQGCQHRSWHRVPSPRPVGVVSVLPQGSWWR